MNPRKVIRIARWEAAKSAGTVDRRTAIVIVLAVAAAGLVAPVLVGGGGATLDDGVYRVAVDEDSQYHDPVVEHSSLRAVHRAADAEIEVHDGAVHAGDSPKAQAALAEFRSAVQSYNNRQLADEEDRAAAFPVVVQVRYEERGGTGFVPSDPDGTDDETGTDDGDGGSGDDSGQDDETSDFDEPGDADDDEDGRLSVPEIGGPGGIDGVDSGTPADISPPFPFGSLVLAFLFVIPMNFVIQAYGSTIMGERLNRRGELMLVAPVTGTDVVIGKTLPYFGALMAVTVLIAAVVGGGLLSILAVVPIALLFLAATFVGAMFARSYKELTFVTVTLSVLLTTYVFVPAIFSDVTPIALISPLTLVVLDLQGESVSALEAAFSTGPFLILSAVLFGLGIGVYREEDMFTQRPVHLKALDALAAWIHGYRHVAAASAVLLPLAFVLPLLSVAILFALPRSFALPLLLVAVSVTEELAKSLGVLAAYEHDRFERTVPVALALGIASGAGFFVAEKATHAVQIVGLHELEIGAIAFAPEVGVSPALAAVLFFLPLALHCVTAAISALGARRGGSRYVLAVALAVLFHTAYNLGVIALVA